MDEQTDTLRCIPNLTQIKNVNTWWCCESLLLFKDFVLKKKKKFWYAVTLDGRGRFVLLYELAYRIHGQFFYNDPKTKFLSFCKQRCPHFILCCKRVSRPLIFNTNARLCCTFAASRMFPTDVTETCKRTCLTRLSLWCWSRVYLLCRFSETYLCVLQTEAFACFRPSTGTMHSGSKCGPVLDVCLFFFVFKFF